LREKKTSFVVPDSDPVGCGFVSTGKSSEILLTSSGSNVGRIMEFYLKNVVNFVSYIEAQFLIPR